MAYYGKRRSYGKRKGKAKSSKYTELERLAFNMGKISRGLKNPNSRVFESYKNGVEKKTSSSKKPLID